MAETTKVVAKKRDRAGKGGARSSRRDGLIPAVIYGDKQAPVMIAVEPKSVEREMHKEGFFNHQLKIEVDGQGFYFFFFLMIRRPQRYTLFPYATLFRSQTSVPRRRATRPLQIGRASCRVRV